jgi:hypothetical protein
MMALLWALVLFAFWAAEEGRCAAGDERPAKLRNWPGRVEGLGLDTDKARENALKTAREQVISWLRRHEPRIISWTPSTDFIQELIVKEGEGKEQPLGVVAAKSWLIYLKAPPRDKLYQMERSQRGEERMLLLAKVLGGVLVLLLAVVGYVRLDDLTRGYYTRWLQVVGAGLIAGACAGLWFLSW